MIEHSVPFSVRRAPVARHTLPEIRRSSKNLQAAIYPIPKTMLFKESVHIQDVLLQVALGHSLLGSRSCLAALSKDILQNTLATAIEEAYWESRSQEGLLTPKPLAKSKFSSEIPEKIVLPDQAIRRAVVRPTSYVPRPFTNPWTFTPSNCYGHESLRKSATSPRSPRVQPPHRLLPLKSPEH